MLYFNSTNGFGVDFFGIPEKFLYIRIPNGEYEFFDEAVTGMSPQFSSVKSGKLTKNL